ncbi:MAG: DNA topoisomerase I [Candidatus Hadarchaeum sp.]|uniref:DNA topoisomerase I n=1 Tax=Candidatus Hadarchaeum sp. TaxID=2883567 RepID=UPI003D146AEE
MAPEFKIERLRHNGVIIPSYEPKGFSIRWRGKTIKLTPEQEEMAVAWVKKLGTDYVKDPVFVKNFGEDFSKALGFKDPVPIEEFDFSEIIRWAESEKAKKESMSREEKKKLAEARKKAKEENKQKYGYAEVNGQLVEIANYTVEPPCIFVGRGLHPLRGRWKPRVTYEDIILNLSDDAPTPETPPEHSWGGRVFEPESLWIAKWRDKLTGELKYVWVADSAFFKQEREKDKFDKANELEKSIDKVRKHINENLESEDIMRRKIATVAYLIDTLKMRVGDEKDEDEADTVGATTLRGCHVQFEDSNTVKFDFLGKDAVRWTKSIKPPPVVIRNLKSFIKGPDEPIFDGIRSEMVNDFLGEVAPWLTAKVFRTYHATKVVRECLNKSKVKPEDPEFKKKYVATLANLEAAITCNHKRKLPKNWETSLEKKKERVRTLETKLEEVMKKPKTAAREKQIKKLKEKIKEAKLKVELATATKDYNLGTSLKSYIDPRAFVSWAKKVGYDWRKYYPKTLQRKYAWADEDNDNPPSGPSG